MTLIELHGFWQAITLPTVKLDWPVCKVA